MTKTKVLASIQLPCDLNTFVVILEALAKQYQGQKVYVRTERNHYIVFKEETQQPPA